MVENSSLTAMQLINILSSMCVCAWVDVVQELQILNISLPAVHQDMNSLLVTSEVFIRI